MPIDCDIFEIHVGDCDIDDLGHANNASYLKWVQAATLDHWYKHAPKQATEMFRWVAVRHEITYRKPTYLNDRITLIINLQRIKRESAFYNILLMKSDCVIAEVNSRWCCIDRDTRLPVRLPQYVIDQFCGH